MESYEETGEEDEEDLSSLIAGIPWLGPARAAGSRGGHKSCKGRKPGVPGLPVPGAARAALNGCRASVER